MQLFSHHGLNPFDEKRCLTASQTKRLNAVMQTCGFYDEAGEFTFAVGLPGKSGVGGGIAALLPGQYSIAVWSPELNSKGNSVLGMKALELFTTKTGRSVF
jgi:glutaminase